jgi:hypothetical protein
MPRFAQTSYITPQKSLKPRRGIEATAEIRGRSPPGFVPARLSDTGSAAQSWISLFHTLMPTRPTPASRRVSRSRWKIAL